MHLRYVANNSMLNSSNSSRQNMSFPDICYENNSFLPLTITTETNNLLYAYIMYIFVQVFNITLNIYAELKYIYMYCMSHRFLSVYPSVMIFWHIYYCHRIFIFVFISPSPFLKVTIHHPKIRNHWWLPLMIPRMKM